jgi:hypothetical protein
MARRFFNLATLLSLLLAMASFAMWARSQFVTEAWEFKPGPPTGRLLHRLAIWDSVGGKGSQQSCRAVQSFGGRLAFVQYDRLARFSPPPVTGYQRFAKTSRYERDGHMDRIRRNWPLGFKPEGRFPGVAEWYFSPARSTIPSYGTQRFIVVSWLAVALAFAVLPGVRVGWHWWRHRRPSTRPAFPVITPGPPQ